MSHALHTVAQILIGLSSLAILVWPIVIADEDDLDANEFDPTYIP